MQSVDKPPRVREDKQLRVRMVVLQFCCLSVRVNGERDELSRRPSELVLGLLCTCFRV